jgi:hypothetical protein
MDAKILNIKGLVKYYGEKRRRNKKQQIGTYRKNGLHPVNSKYPLPIV